MLSRVVQRKAVEAGPDKNCIDCGREVATDTFNIIVRLCSQGYWRLNPMFRSLERNEAYRKETVAILRNKALLQSLRSGYASACMVFANQVNGLDPGGAPLSII